MTDRIRIETKGNRIVEVEYTDGEGNKVNIDHVTSIQTYRIMSSDGSADKVQLVLVPDVVEWAADFGEGS